MDRSDDDGKTWNKSQEVEISQLEYKSGERTVGKDDSSIPVSEQSFYGRGVIQPTLWESIPDQVHMLLRSTEGRSTGATPRRRGYLDRSLCHGTSE